MGRRKGNFHEATKDDCSYCEGTKLHWGKECYDLYKKDQIKP